MAKLPTARVVKWQAEGLPDPEGRFTSRKKMTILNFLANNLDEEDEVLQLYNLSKDELASWREQFMKNGQEGLKVTKRHN